MSIARTILAPLVGDYLMRRAKRLVIGCAVLWAGFSGWSHVAQKTDIAGPQAMIVDPVANFMGYAPAPDDDGTIGNNIADATADATTTSEPFGAGVDDTVAEATDDTTNGAQKLAPVVDSNGNSFRMDIPMTGMTLASTTYVDREIGVFDGANKGNWFMRFLLGAGALATLVHGFRTLRGTKKAVQNKGPRRFSEAGRLSMDRKDAVKNLQVDYADNGARAESCMDRKARRLVAASDRIKVKYGPDSKDYREARVEELTHVIDRHERQFGIVNKAIALLRSDDPDGRKKELNACKGKIGQTLQDCRKVRSELQSA